MDFGRIIFSDRSFIMHPAGIVPTDFTSIRKPNFILVREKKTPQRLMSFICAILGFYLGERLLGPDHKYNVMWKTANDINK